MRRLLCLLSIVALLSSGCTPREVPDKDKETTETQDPVSEDPVSEDPVSEDPESEDPESEDPETQDPGTEDPVSEDPVSEDPVSEDPVQDGPVADILDVIFQPDGTAVNGAEDSPMTVKTFPGSGLTTYYNETYGLWTAHFNHGVASGISDGFYKADYSSLGAIRDKMKKGITMEALVRLDSQNPSGAETKFFSSMQSGGIGFLIPTSSNGGSWTWLPNVSTTGGSNWIWTKSGVTPVIGRYVHLVGIWDKESGISRIYVNGECKATQITEGNLNFPGTNSCWWFCIGGDPNSASTAESAWNGDVAIARIYGRALEEEEIIELWNVVDVAGPSESITLSNVEYISPCNIRPGYKFLVYADGLGSGDRITLTSPSGDKYEPDTQVFDGYAKVTVSSDIPSGTYSMLCIRGDASFPLGSLQLNVSEDAQNDVVTRVVAHRGYHDGASGTVRPENSIAALKAAQELGIYGSEFDVWMTTDGGLFINHDGVHKGVTIQNSTSETVAALTLSNGEKIPTLEQYLEQGKKDPGTRLVLEIKTHGSEKKNNDVVDACVALVQEMDLVDQVDWIAFSYDICKRIHAALPESMVEYLNGGKTPAALYADGIMGLDYSSLQQSWIAEAHERGMIVNVWTINSPGEMLKYISWGVDFITTNQPDLCKRLCEKTWITAD